MKQERKIPVNIFESNYNQLTLIAKKEGFLYPEGHAHAGRTNFAQTVGYVLATYAKVIAA